MDKVENWITWALMFALIYTVKQAPTQSPCVSSNVSPWGVVTALQGAQQSQSSLSGFSGGCGCAGGCGGC